MPGETRINLPNSGIGRVADVLCSFDSIFRHKGDELWDGHRRVNFANMRCALIFGVGDPAAPGRVLRSL